MQLVVGGEDVMEEDALGGAVAAAARGSGSSGSSGSSDSSAGVGAAPAAPTRAAQQPVTVEDISQVVEEMARLH